MSRYQLSYDRPAENWTEGLPIGNGRLGAVVCSGIGHETWHLSEVTFWSGQAETIQGPANERADLERLRKLFFAGDYRGGEQTARRILQPAKRNYGTNLPLCRLNLRFGMQGARFRRKLDLELALAAVSFESDGAVHEREMFASHADGVIASRIRSGNRRAVTFRIDLEGDTDGFRTAAGADGVLRFAAQALETMHSDGACGVRAVGIVRVVANGGTVSAESGGLVVRDADEAVVYVAVSTDYPARNADLARECERRLERAAAKGYERLKADHIRDYRELFGRVRLELEDGGGRSDLPTDERIRRLKDGADDPSLFALFYQYGRYLMIAGARRDSPLPLHLQGIWNDGRACRMEWTCDYHLDINTQMNYDPAGTGNLSECRYPLLRFIEKLAESGRKAADHFYDCEGWVAHVFTNAWGFTSPGWDISWGLHVTGGLWLAAYLREHYEFTLEDEFLSGIAYPVLKEAALFFLDYMTAHPKYGWLVTGPSNSPENSFYPDERKERPYHLSMGPTIDRTLVRELFAFCLEASERLGTDPELRPKFRRALAQLPPLRIGRGGRLQEWLEDYEEAEPGHRHLSHLYGLFPGREISPDTTPELAEAAKRTLESRKKGGALKGVEFTAAWFSACYARLRDGDAALAHLANLIGGLCFDNLLTYSEPGIAGAESRIFVIDGNFGGAAAIAEMLLQSHIGEMFLLPALPDRWRRGSVSGLRARGNAEVDIVWENGELVEANIRAFSACRTVVRCGAHAVPLEMEPGREYRFDRHLRLMDE